MATPHSRTATGTTTGATTPGATSAPGSATRAGVVGGLVGGLVFGMLMQMMGMIPMVAMLVGSDSIAVGWLVHLGISAVFGVGFTAVFSNVIARFAGRRLTGTPGALGAGAAYGMVLWVVGPLLLMPAKLGMPLLQLNATALQSLMGHVIYGVVLGLVAARLIRR